MTCLPQSWWRDLKTGELISGKELARQEAAEEAAAKEAGEREYVSWFPIFREINQGVAHKSEDGAFLEGMSQTVVATFYYLATDMPPLDLFEAK